MPAAPQDVAMETTTPVKSVGFKEAVESPSEQDSSRSADTSLRLGMCYYTVGL